MNKLSTFRKQQTESFLNVSAVGNQILLDDRTISSAAIDYAVSGLNGNADGLYKILSKISYTATGVAFLARVQLNDDTASTYIVSRVYGGYTGTQNVVGGDTGFNSTQGMALSEFLISGTNPFTVSEMIIHPATGFRRSAITRSSIQSNEGAYTEVYSSNQPNTSANITKLRIHTQNNSILNAVIKLYKQNDIS